MILLSSKGLLSAAAIRSLHAVSICSDEDSIRVVKRERSASLLAEITHFLHAVKPLRTLVGDQAASEFEQNVKGNEVMAMVISGL
jgi:hypothetical protein